jgi:hypothetical protein
MELDDKTSAGVGGVRCSGEGPDIKSDRQTSGRKRFFNHFAFKTTPTHMGRGMEEKEALIKVNKALIGGGFFSSAQDFAQALVRGQKIGATPLKRDPAC